MRTPSASNRPRRGSYLIYAAAGLTLGVMIGLRPVGEVRTPDIAPVAVDTQKDEESLLKTEETGGVKRGDRRPASLLGASSKGIGLQPLNSKSTLPEVKEHIVRIITLGSDTTLSDNEYWAAGKRLTEFIRAEPEKAKAAYRELLIGKDTEASALTRAHALESAWEIPELKNVAVQTAPLAWDRALAEWSHAKSDDDLALPQMALKIEFETASAGDRARIFERRLEQARSKKDPYLVEMVRAFESEQ